MPEQIVTVPPMLAVGSGLTVTIALPVMFGLGAETLQVVATSVTLIIVYVVLTVGLTFTVEPLLRPLALKFDVPSV